MPTARDLVVTNFAAGSEGKFVRFSVRAYNREGQVDSGTYVAILHAAIPSKPSQTPQHVAAESNSTIIALTLPELLTAETGNTDILAYSLEMDDGRAGDFFQVAPESMIVEYNVTVERGLIYRFRYRANNSVGWGPYSDHMSVLAAQPPVRPPQPAFVSSTGTSLTLAFEESTDDGGARISAYELWMSSDYVSASPTFSQVTGYSNNAMGYTLSAADGLVAGTMYAFKCRAVNVKGNSEFSEELNIAAAAPIAKPATPTRNLEFSNKTSLRIEWSESTATEIEVSGYILYMGEGTAGNFVPIYNGSLNALQREYDVTDLATGQLY